MKMFNEISATAFVVAISFVSFGVLTASAATTPSLGQATSYGVLSSTFTDTSSATVVNGSVGFTTPPSTVIGGTHLYYGSGAPYSTAGTDQGAALSALAAQSCTFTFGAGAIDLSTDITHGTAGVFTPGVYCSAGAMNISGPLTLSGTGTYIFRSAGALTSTNGSIMTMTGASACDVFWTPTQATTLGTNTTFFGTIIDASGITVGANTTWSGRALAFGGTVTTDTDTITVPTTCSVAPVVSGGGNRPGTINVVKTVVNDNGGSKNYSDFPLYVNGQLVLSGVTNSFTAPAPAFTITEGSSTGYVRTFSGDCDINGQLNLSPGDNKFCIITNDDIGAPVAVPPVPPLIDVVKTPSSLSLPSGPGPVTYTYTLRNIGTVPVANLTMIGDSCSPIVLISGDINSDSKLDINETWVYKCSKTLTETHTNTVVATGIANGIMATDIASATVVVGESIVPPLINITKIPSPLTLLSGGGSVNYTVRVTNPGTVALSNIVVTDSKCQDIKYISGDTNGNSKIETSETWIYSCMAYLTKNMTNVAIAKGEANGLTIRDFAFATVLVAVPGLPNTGIWGDTWSVVLLGSALVIALGALFVAVKKRKA